MTSQTRLSIEDEGLTILSLVNDEAILRTEDGNLVLYAKNDDYAGTVVEINGEGYEFITSMDEMPE